MALDNNYDQPETLTPYDPIQDAVTGYDAAGGFAPNIVSADQNGALFNFDGAVVRYDVAQDDFIVYASQSSNMNGYAWLRVPPQAPTHLQRQALLNQAARYDARASTWESAAASANAMPRHNSQGNDGESGVTKALILMNFLALFNRLKSKELKEEANTLPNN